MCSVTCAECAVRVHGPWFRHDCFAAKPRNVWVTPHLEGPDGADFDVLPQRLALRTAPPAVHVQPLWDARRGSFKHAAVAAAAGVGLRLGYRRFAVPSCGSAALGLCRWAAPHGVEVELWIPAAARPVEDPGARLVVVSGSWAETYRRFWERCRRDDGVYPVFPAGDPWFLAALRRQARPLLRRGCETVVVPCASGVHLAALLEEAEDCGTRSEIVAVQLAGSDPLVRAWRSLPRPQAAAPPCGIVSMWSQRPVNLERILVSARRVGRVALETVSARELATAEAAHAPELKLGGVCVDRSLFAELAVCARPAFARRGRICVISTAGRAERPLQVSEL